METHSATKFQSLQVRRSGGTGARSSLINSLPPNSAFACGFGPSRDGFMGYLDADVFVPECRIRDDEVFHQLDTGSILQHLHLDAVAGEVCLITHKGDVFTHDHVRDLIE